MGNISTETADEQLITLSAQGNKEAFDTLCNRHIHTLRRHVISLATDEDDANDIIQETLIKAFTKISLYKSNISFSGWLCSIGRNLFIDSVRCNNSKNNIPISELSSSSSITDEDSDIWSIKEDKIVSIENAFLKLPREYREVLNMYFFLDMSYEDISEKMSVPIGTIKTWIHRAKKELKKEVNL